MQLWKGVARQISSQGALKKLPAATSQFHGAIALPLDHSSYAMGTGWSFGVWCLWSPCSMVQDTLCSPAVVASGEMQHRHENMLQELREPILAEEHFKYDLIVFIQYYSIEPPKYSAHFSLGAQWMNCWFWPKSLVDRFETNARWDIWNTLKKWKPARPSFILRPSVDCL